VEVIDLTDSPPSSPRPTTRPTAVLTNPRLVDFSRPYTIAPRRSTLESPPPGTYIPSLASQVIPWNSGPPSQLPLWMQPSTRLHIQPLSNVDPRHQLEDVTRHATMSYWRRVPRVPEPLPLFRDSTPPSRSDLLLPPLPLPRARSEPLPSPTPLPDLDLADLIHKYAVEMEIDADEQKPAPQPAAVKPPLFRGGLGLMTRPTQTQLATGHHPMACTTAKHAPRHRYHSLSETSESSEDSTGRVVNLGDLM
jgi:hypothetical protein